MKNSIGDAFTEILCSTMNGRDKYMCVYIQTLNGSFIRIRTSKISRDQVNKQASLLPLFIL